MAKNYKRFLTLALVPFVAINIYAGSKIANKQKNMKDVNDDFVSSNVVSTESTEVHVSDTQDYEASVEDVHVSETQDYEASIEDVHVETLDPFEKLQRIYNSNEKSIEEILNTESVNSELYASALLMKLLNAGIPVEAIRNELNNVIVTGSVMIDVDNIIWDLLYGNLNSTLSLDTNVVEYYYPLAKYVHLYECKLEHEDLWEAPGRIACDKIDKDLMTMNDGLLFENYVLNDIYMNQIEKYTVPMDRILYSGIDVDKAFQELENIYIMAMYPRCCDEEEWYSLFGTLLKTVKEDENVCVYYYDLACYIHELKCENEHYINECGQLECEEYRLKLGF